MIDSIRGGIRNLTRKKSRSVLTILSIAIGVASVILITSIGEIGKDIINKEIEGFGAGAVAISVNDERYPRAKLGEAELEVFRSSTDTKNAVPMVMEYTDIFMRGLVARCIIWGTDQYVGDVVAMDLKHGRLLNKSDVASGARVCVVDEKMAIAYYGRSNIVGKTLLATFPTGALEYEVIGVSKSGGDLTQAVLSEYAPLFIYAPYTSLPTMRTGKNFDQVAIKPVDKQSAELVGMKMLQKISGEQNIPEAYSIENMSKYQEKFNTIFDIVTMVLTVIAAISVVVAGLGIMTVMLVSVNERTKEIGIKKSIGAKSRFILLEFLIEAFTISLLGSLAGMVVALVIVGAGCFFLGIPLLVNVLSTAKVMLCAVAVGVIFGVYPAFLASKLTPVESLRFEI